MVDLRIILQSGFRLDSNTLRLKMDMCHFPWLFRERLDIAHSSPKNFSLQDKFSGLHKIKNNCTMQIIH